jgi:transcriptional regulator with XRE-family HTH domain
MKIERDDKFLFLLAKNVRTNRLSANISQEELAWQCDIDRTYISKIERGVANPSILILVKISEVLGVNLIDLLLESTSK